MIIYFMAMLFDLMIAIGLWVLMIYAIVKILNSGNKKGGNK